MSNFIFICKNILNGDIYVRHHGSEYILVPSHMFDPSFCISYYREESFFICTVFHSTFQQHLQQGDQLPEQGRDGWLKSEIPSCQNSSSLREFVHSPSCSLD